MTDISAIDIAPLIARRDAIRADLLARLAAGQAVTWMDCVPLRMAADAVAEAVDHNLHWAAMSALPDIIASNDRPDRDWR